MSIYFEGGVHSGDVGITANELLGNQTGLSVKNAVKSYGYGQCGYEHGRCDKGTLC